MNYQAVVAYASIATAFGVLLIGIQIIVALKNLKAFRAQIIADHERSRIEKAIDLLNDYTKGLDKAMPSARTLVNKLSETDCEKLRDKLPLTVPIEKKKLLENILQDVMNDHPLEESDGLIQLNENHTSHIFYLCMSHLNSLEVIFQAWVSGIADSEIIERQFSYLISPSKRNDLLRNFRKVVGGPDVYPAIYAFVEHIEGLIIKRSEVKLKPKIA